MNKIIAALAIAVTLTTTVTAYAQNPTVLWCFLYPPVGCSGSGDTYENGDIVVKFKLVELAKEVRQWIEK